jgi:hypothetical protein
MSLGDWCDEKHWVVRGEAKTVGAGRAGERLAAGLIPARNDVSLKEAFAEIERIRMRGKPLPKGVTVKDLIEEGRR